jgi:hypothetical protein
MEDDPRKLTEIFLGSLGISSDIAVDVMEVLLKARAEDVALRTAEIRDSVLKLRKERKIKEKKGLTLRNIQIWIKYFKEIKLVDRVGERGRFTGNKKPSEAFSEYTKPVIYESSSFVENVLKKAEEAYGIK